MSSACFQSKVIKLLTRISSSFLWEMNYLIMLGAYKRSRILSLLRASNRAKTLCRPSCQRINSCEERLRAISAISFISMNHARILEVITLSICNLHYLLLSNDFIRLLISVSLFCSFLKLCTPFAMLYLCFICYV